MYSLETNHPTQPTQSGPPERRRPRAAWLTAAVLASLLAACGSDANTANRADRDADTHASGPLAPGATHRGQATFYAATGGGHCSFDESPNDLMVAAVNMKDYARSAACGTTLKVTGPEGSVHVRVVDSCPGCRKGGLDLSPQAFKKIASLDDGRVDIEWEVVKGDDGDPVTFKYKPGSSRLWVALQVRDHALPIKKVEIKPEGTDEWYSTKRKVDNYFVQSKDMPNKPLDVRVTAVDGSQITDTLPPPKAGLVAKGDDQF